MSLLVLEPPYDHPLPAGPFHPALGAVLVADLSLGIPALAGALIRHREAPWCPLVTCLTDRRVSGADLATFESVPGSLAPLYAGDYPAESLASRALRAVHRRPPPLPTTMASWVEYRVGLPGIAGPLAACYALESGTARPPRTITRRLQQLGNLEVRDWRGVMRLARILGVAPGRTRRSLEITALEAGVDPRTLRRWVRLVTPRRWRAVAGRVGWEWVLEAALRRHGGTCAERRPRQVRLVGQAT